MARRRVDTFVPLKPNWFHILLSLADGPRHGYAIMQEVHERTKGKLRLWPTQLYGSIRRMEDAGMVVAAAEPAPADDERRQYYAITDFGVEVLRAETHRLRALVRLAQSRV